MEQQAVETKFFRHVDSDAAIVRKKMQETGLKALSSKERAGWVCFLMSLRIRQPEIVTLLREDAIKVLRSKLDEQPEQYEEIAQHGDAPTSQEWTKQRFPGLIENFGLSLFHKLILDSYIGEKIFRMKWWLWDFRNTERELLLSDRPCIFINSLNNEDCIIALPISPDKAFMATRSERVAAIMRIQDPKHLVMRLNESSVSQSRVRIYSRDNFSRRFI